MVNPKESASKKVLIANCLFKERLILTEILLNRCKINKLLTYKPICRNAGYMKDAEILKAIN